MKRFTKYLMLILAMLVTFGITAQIRQNIPNKPGNMSEEEFQMYVAKQQPTFVNKGPNIPAPADMGGGERAQGDDCTDPYIYGNVNDPAQYGSIVSYGSQWYELYVQEDFNVTFSLCGSSYDTYLGIWSDCSTQDYTNDDFCGLQSQITAFYPGGSTIYVRVYGYSSSYGSYVLNITGIAPPPPAEPITSFPFLADMEDCTAPPELQLKNGSNMTNVVVAAAGNESSCGIRMAGIVYNYFYYSSTCSSSIYYNIPPAEGGYAYSSYGNHWSKIVMDVRPDGTAGSLQLDFDQNQFYSYSQYYNAFEVWINGDPVSEKETGTDCFRASSGSGNGWTKFIYDLSGYQLDPQIDIEIVFVGAYGAGYGSSNGDAAFIDNVHVWYVPSGDVEGYAYNNGVPVPGVEVGFIGDNAPYPPVMTDGSGYYRFSNVPTEPISLWPMYACMLIMMA